jgi:hypothetical protein
MNWKLIFALSGFGLFMAVATVYVIPSNIEIFFWLAIFGICAWLIQKHAPGKYFAHGFLVCILNCVWITGGHILLSAPYLLHHPEEQEAYNKMYGQFKITMTQAMLLFGPFIGILSGIFLGLLSSVFARIRQSAR